jgi:carboxylesterase type B
VSEYLGIPYAHPLVGHLRWTAPKPLTGNNRPLKTAKFSATCLRNIIKQQSSADEKGATARNPQKGKDDD